MPEMKRNFTKGKMNKDLDERLVPPGEYRDAMNIQVATSEGSDVGTVQNILGNTLGCDQDVVIADGSKTVGSISDEKNDTLYWFVAGPPPGNIILGTGMTHSFKDLIMRVNKGECEPVFVDKYQFCVGIDRDISTHVTNSIILDDPDLYSNITPGMYAEGFDNTGASIGFPSTLIGSISGVTEITLFFNLFNPGGNIINTSSNNQFLDDIYNILYDSTTGTATGASLQIDDTIGAGMIFPPNSCIDPNSVSAPPPYDSNFEIVDCNTGNPNNSIPNPPPNALAQPLTLFTDPQFGLQAIILNNDIDLQGVDTICFNADKTLNFDPTRSITGINIIDDMLFWTDNFSEPKRINIPRSIAGTESNGDRHTAVVNTAAGLDLINYNPVREEHITVIRKNPKNVLNLELNDGRDPSLNYTGTTNTVLATSAVPTSIIGSSNNAVVNDFSALQIDDTVRFKIETDVNGNTGFHVAWDIGDYLLLKEFTGVPLTSEPVPLANWTIRGRITNWQGNNFLATTSFDAQVEIEIISLTTTPPDPDPSTPNAPLSYTVDLENENKIIFEDKLPRFSYRYRYEDGEYSIFAPWSEVAFVPGNFDYDPKKGWNTGMINHLVSLKVKNFIPIIPGQSVGQDIVSVDILYKEDTSPNVYVVDTISPNDISQILPNGNIKPLPWDLDEYEIVSETIKNILPSNQLLRSWDNVPKRSLAQEITGNRLVYANYEQGYDLEVGGAGNKKYKPSFARYLKKWDTPVEGVPGKSIKSLRDYKLGVVFTDKYGRETPILIGESGGFKVQKKNSIRYNRLAVGLTGDAPDSMAYFKFYIKETSTEYYNLAMDRWYAAEDGNIWLAFPSSDRNKVDLDTSLYFKKGDDDTVLENTTKYKVLALENEAPEFIRTRRVQIGRVKHDTTTVINAQSGDVAQIFGEAGSNLLNAPTVGNASFMLDYVRGGFGGTSISHLDEITEDLYIQFASSSDYSAEYKISEITADRKNDIGEDQIPIKYYVTLDTAFKDDINFIFDDPTVPSLIKDDTWVRIKKGMIEKSPKFDGRFFAKIENDGKIKTQMTDTSIGVNYVEKTSKDIYLLEDDNKLRTVSGMAAHDRIITTASQTNHPAWGITGNTNYVRDSFSSWVHPVHIGANKNNPSGLNFNYVYARQTYFGNIKYFPSEYGHWDFGMGAPDHDWENGPLTIKTRGNDPSDNFGVWFINRSTRKYYKDILDYGDELEWHNLNNMNGFTPDCNLIGPGSSPPCGTVIHTPTYSNGHGTQNYTNSSNVNLSFGGFGGQVYTNLIHHGGGNWHFHGALSNFWSIGNGNPYQTGGAANNENFVERLTGGYSFKWKEDPTETIYTISNQASHEHWVRFGRRDDGHQEFNFSKNMIGADSSYQKNWFFNVEPSMQGWDPAGPVGDYMDNGLILGTGEIAPGSSGNPGDYHEITTHGSIITANSTVLTLVDGTDFSNIHIGMSVIDTTYYSGTIDIFAKVVSINPSTTSPTVTLSEENTINIPAGTDLKFGYTIRVVSEHVYPVTSPNKEDNYIIVNDKTTACGNGNTLKPTYTLEAGMMLDAYNLDSTEISPSYNNVIIKGPPIADGNNWKINLTGYKYPLHNDGSASGVDDFASTAWTVGSRIRFRQVTMNGASNYTEENTDLCNNGDSGGIGAVGYTMQMVEPVEEYSEGGNLPQNPFVWETEPKDDTELDIYYEISENNPLILDSNTINTMIPLGSEVVSPSNEGGFEYLLPSGSATVTNNSFADGNIIELSHFVWVGPGPDPLGTQPVEVGSRLQIIRPSGVKFEIEVIAITENPALPQTAYRFHLQPSLSNITYFLSWYNCYSFGNGVESNRIKDNFNLPFIVNGVKASTTLDREYKKERRKHGLIYSGIYNSTSGVNNLNQFIAAEKITKDLNPIYGSIQKLHAGWGQGGNLVALCEDRILKILANKDALYNADGNTNVTATNRVLGTATPYSGEFGISKNPESFASESYRAYFTDKVRGTVMRLSMDGLTPISDAGMKDWFRDNLKLSYKTIGSYDDKKNEYNLTNFTKVKTIKPDGTVIFRDRTDTVTYREDVKGWVSFKSFIPENGISCANEYYTFQDGQLWMHHYDKVKTRNTFYNAFTHSSISVIINDLPGTIKTFHTLNYEGSQSKVDSITSSAGEADKYDTWDYTSWDGTFNNGVPNYGTVENTIADSDYYNLTPSGKTGWYVENITTDKEVGTLNEFIEKEGKWFNYIKGKAW